MDVLLSLSVSLHVSLFLPVPSLSQCISCNYNGTGKSVHISSAAFKITSNNPKSVAKLVSPRSCIMNESLIAFLHRLAIISQKSSL